MTRRMPLRPRRFRRVAPAATPILVVLALVACGAPESRRPASSRAPAAETVASDATRLEERFPRHVAPPNPVPPNTLSATDREAGWKLLFDGRDGAAWRARDGEAFPDVGWSTAGGELALEAAGFFALRAGGDLFSVDRYHDFVLDFEFALTPGANSDVKYRARANDGFSFVDSIGCEYQILDDARHPDADRGRDGNRRLASLYDLVPAASPWPRAIGAWNHARIHVEDGAVAHYLNGDRVLLVDFRSGEWDVALAESKFAGAEAFCADVEGHLVLQDHGDAVRFRNLRVRSLDRVVAPDANP